MIVLDTAARLWHASDPGARRLRGGRLVAKGRVALDPPRATAWERSATLVTPDRRLQSYPHVATLW